MTSFDYSHLQFSVFPSNFLLRLYHKSWKPENGSSQLSCIVHYKSRRSLQPASQICICRAWNLNEFSSQKVHQVFLYCPQTTFTMFWENSSMDFRGTQSSYRVCDLKKEGKKTASCFLLKSPKDLCFCDLTRCGEKLKLNKSMSNNLSSKLYT